MDNKDFGNSIDLLNDSVTRICVSDDPKEISAMCDFAIKRLIEIKNYRLDQDEPRGITYEEVRQHYADQENREQEYIVKIQQLMIENDELKKSKEGK